MLNDHSGYKFFSRVANQPLKELRGYVVIKANKSKVDYHLETDVVQESTISQLPIKLKYLKTSSTTTQLK